MQNFPEASFAGADGAGPRLAKRADAFVYAGGLMEVQGVREMAQAFALLPEGMIGTVAGWFHPRRSSRRLPRCPAGGACGSLARCRAARSSRPWTAHGPA